MPNEPGQVLPPALIERARRCVCGHSQPVFDADVEGVPGMVVMRCCGAIYQWRGVFLSLIKEGFRTAHIWGAAETSHASADEVDVVAVAGQSLAADGVSGPKILAVEPLLREGGGNV